MAVPTVMRWDHKNAPTIDDRTDWVQIKNWFTTIFDTGYLADDDVTLIPGLGWDVTFEDETVWRYVYLDSDKDNTSNVNHFRVRFSFRYMIDNSYYGGAMYAWEDKSQRGQLTHSYNVTYNYIGTFAPFGHSTSIGRIAPWVVIGSKRGVFFFSGYNETIVAPEKPVKFTEVDNYSQWSYYGDYINDGVDMDIYNQCCTYEYATYNATYKVDAITFFDNYNLFRNMTSYGFRGTRSYPAMTDTDTRMVNWEYYQTTGGSFYIGAPAYGLPYPSPNNTFYMKPMELWDTTDKVYKGRIPGMFYSSHKRPLAHGETLLDFYGQGGDYDGKHFLGMGRLAYDEFYINVTDDWEID